MICLLVPCLHWSANDPLAGKSPLEAKAKCCMTQGRGLRHIELCGQSVSMVLGLMRFCYFQLLCLGLSFDKMDFNNASSCWCGNTVEASQSSICPDATMEHAGLNNTHTTLCSSKARKTPRRPMSGTHGCCSYTLGQHWWATPWHAYAPVH